MEHNGPQPTDQFLVLLEDIRSQVQLIAEGHDLLNMKIDKLDTKIDAVRAELKGDVQALALGLKRVETNLGQKIDRLTDKVETHDKDIHALKERVA